MQLDAEQHTNIIPCCFDSTCKKRTVDSIQEVPKGNHDACVKCRVRPAEISLVEFARKLFDDHKIQFTDTIFRYSHFLADGRLDF